MPESDEVVKKPKLPRSHSLVFAGLAVPATILSSELRDPGLSLALCFFCLVLVAAMAIHVRQYDCSGGSDGGGGGGDGGGGGGCSGGGSCS